MKECVSCGLPEGKFNVHLNTGNICNYCLYFNRKKEQIVDFNKKKHLLTSRFNKFKGKYDYDAVVGLSGGKDSTYILYKLIKEYKLKVLAITYDNGFLTRYAKKSIKRTIKRLEVPHLYYRPNRVTLGKFYNAAVNSFGDPCIACALGGYFLSVKVCYELKIPFFVHGRSPYQMYRNYYEGSPDLFLILLDLNLQEHSFNQIAQVYTVIYQKLKDYISNITQNENDANEIINEFFLNSVKISEEFVPEFLSYFIFHEYNEKRIKHELENVIGWEKHKHDQLLGHYDCVIHDAAGYAFKAIHGISDLVPDLAVMRRFGAINREEAERLLLSNEVSNNDISASFNKLCKMCRCNRKEVLKRIKTLKGDKINKFPSF